MTVNEKIEQLTAEIRALSARHDSVSMEIQRLYREINKLKLTETQEIIETPAPPPSPQVVPQPVKTENVYLKHLLAKKTAAELHEEDRNQTSKASGLEKFIGENLINKVGI